nr:unnamed protein product [Naegleria fowleri]
MFRAEPQQNYLCKRKVRERNYKKHRDALASIKPSIDNTPPKDYPHLRTNAKKKQLQKERGDQIGKDNRILVDKMTEIMGKHYLDNKNQNYKFIGSLNSDLRRREAKKITEENSAILKRIQNRQPVYNHLQWEQEWTKSRKWMADKTGNIQPVNQGVYVPLNRSKDNIKGVEVVEENEGFSDEEDNSFQEQEFEVLHDEDQFETNEGAVETQIKPKDDQGHNNQESESQKNLEKENGTNVSPIPVLNHQENNEKTTKQEPTQQSNGETSSQPQSHEPALKEEEIDTSFNASFNYEEEDAHTDIPQRSS